jgi:hypothetical protein
MIETAATPAGREFNPRPRVKRLTAASQSRILIAACLFVIDPPTRRFPQSTRHDRFRPPCLASHRASDAPGRGLVYEVWAHHWGVIWSHFSHRSAIQENRVSELAAIKSTGAAEAQQARLCLFGPDRSSGGGFLIHRAGVFVGVTSQLAEAAPTSAVGSPRDVTKRRGRNEMAHDHSAPDRAGGCHVCGLFASTTPLASAPRRSPRCWRLRFGD